MHFFFFLFCFRAYCRVRIVDILGQITPGSKGIIPVFLFHPQTASWGMERHHPHGTEGEMRGYVYVVWSRATESGRVVRYCSVRVVGAVGSVLGNQGPGLPSLQAPDSPVPGLPWWLRGKQPACSAGNAGDEGSTSGSGGSPGGGNGNPCLYSCLENPRDRGAWWAAVHGATKNQIRLKWPSMHARTTIP